MPIIITIFLFILLGLLKSFRHFALYCLIFILLAAPRIQVFSKTIQETSRFMPHLASKKITEYVYQNTGWSLAEYRNNTLQIFTWPEISLELDYLQALKKGSAISKIPEVSGVIIVANKIYNFVNQAEDSQKWPNWKKWANNGRIQILQEKIIENYTVMFYKRIDSSFPSQLQNVGLQYIPLRFQNESPAGQKLSFTTFDTSDSDFYIYWNQKLGLLTFHSQATSQFQTVGPHMFVKHPVMTYLCDGQSKTIRLPDLGHSRKTSAPPGEITYRLGDTVLTPIQYDGIACKNFEPIRFAAHEVSLKTWNRSGTSYPDKIISNFVSESFRE